MRSNAEAIERTASELQAQLLGRFAAQLSDADITRVDASYAERVMPEAWRASDQYWVQSGGGVITPEDAAVSLRVGREHYPITRLKAVPQLQEILEADRHALEDEDQLVADLMEVFGGVPRPDFDAERSPSDAFGPEALVVKIGTLVEHRTRSAHFGWVVGLLGGEKEAQAYGATVGVTHWA